MREEAGEQLAELTDSARVQLRRLTRRSIDLARPISGLKAAPCVLAGLTVLFFDLWVGIFDSFPLPVTTDRLPLAISQQNLIAMRHPQHVAEENS